MIGAIIGDIVGSWMNRSMTLIDCEPAPGAEPTALEHSELGWFTPKEMSALDFCPADAELLPVLFQ